MAETKNHFLFRYPPCAALTLTGFKNQVPVKPQVTVFGESVTDKESYRLSLAGKRGSMGTGSTTTGWYMFQDGKYDHNKDFSYFYRKDLSIVDIDNYINNMTEAQKNADKALASEIQSQIDLANAKKAELAAESKKPDTTSSTE